MATKLQLQQQIEQLKQQLSDTQAQRDELQQSLQQMSDNFEQLISAQTMALEEARDLALSASKTKSEFLANMSHEIRTPLTAIIGFSNSLADENLSDQDVDLATAAIIRNAHHLMDIINDILDLAKIEHQHFELEQVKFDLFGLLHEIEETISAQAIEKNLWFNIHVQFPIPQYIVTDPTWVKQILLNLCSNALKFTEQGGIDIHISFAPQTNRMIIEVVDTGIGISQQQQLKIFERFSQADTTTNRRYGGTGLGLTICTNLLSLMQGKLKVTSEEGKGSCFAFDFIIEPINHHELLHHASQIVTDIEQEPKPQSTPSLCGQVLVAEDSIDTQNLVALYIKKTGATVTFVKDGQQAVEHALANSYDLVLMDIQMPVVDGLEATQILRQVGFSKPIIAFTANAIKQELLQATEAGCDGHITKPIDKKQFYQLLSQYLAPADGPVEVQEDNFLDDQEFTVIRSNFIRRAANLLQQLQLTLDDNEWSNGLVLIHTFKGTCGSLGFKHLFTLVKQLEQVINNPKNRNTGTINQLLSQLSCEVDDQMKQLNLGSKP